MIVQISCLLIGAAALCFWRGVASAGNNRGKAERCSDAGGWEAIAAFALANLGALMGGLDPAGPWSLAAPLWATAFVLQGIFSLCGQKALRLTAFLTGLAMSGWIFALALQWI